MAKMSPREKAIRKRLKADFPHYASRCLRIRDKDGRIDGDGGLPRLHLNQPQRYIHACLEKQLAEKGWVRALILKGRQQGCTTYVQGRYYHKVSHRKGGRAYILTHEDEGTKNIFEMTQRYHDNCPPLVRPSTSASNTKELVFDKLDGGYKVGTAGTKATGRSQTIQYFHGSEVAYWPNAETHMAGVLQAVPGGAGTEIILESTSAGPEGLFYEMCKAAQQGVGDYILIFVPWFWSEEYTRDPGAGFTLTAEEQRYKRDHNLTDGQIAWRRSKIVELRGVHNFRREYPATADEAFKASAVGALWTQELIDRTRVAQWPVYPDDDPRAGEKRDMVKVVVALDPSGGDGPDNDEVGLVTSGLCDDGDVYIWRDDSDKLSPMEWGRRSINIYKAEKADRVVAETNFGADLVEANIRGTLRPGETVTIKKVTASRGKAVRAEPVKALWEEGAEHACHIVGYLPALEDELTTWVPGVSKLSPNRLDAMVWGVTDLVLQESTTMRVRKF